MTANTLIVWKPTEVHGTSLQRWAPGSSLNTDGGDEPDDSDDEDYNPMFLQLGVCTTTAKRAVNAWNKYRDNLERSEALAELYAAMEEGAEDEVKYSWN